MIATPTGQHIPISQVAKIKISIGPSMIESENGILRSTVQLNVRGRDISSFVEEAKVRIEEKIKIPRGYSVEWAGQYRNIEKSNQKLLLLVPLSLLLNLLIIYFNFRSFSLSAIVFSAIPVAAAGGLILLNITNTPTSVAVWVGFIALFGIAVDDGVVMMSFLKEKLKKDQVSNFEELKEIILEAGSRRIRPLIMTTLTTIFALLPILWASGQGSEVMRPMAIPILGGMIIEFITLFIVPVVFSFIYQKKIETNLSNSGEARYDSL